MTAEESRWALALPRQARVSVRNLASLHSTPADPGSICCRGPPSAMSACGEHCKVNLNRILFRQLVQGSYGSAALRTGRFVRGAEATRLLPIGGACL
jgi:hypothetical protein